MINPSCFYSRGHVGALEHWSFVPVSKLWITGIILVDLRNKRIIARLGNEREACARGVFSTKGNTFYYAQGNYGKCSYVLHRYGGAKEHSSYNLNKLMAYNVNSNTESVVAVAAELEGAEDISPIFISDKDELYVLICTESALLLDASRIIWSLAIINKESKQLQVVVSNYWPYSEVAKIDDLLVHANGWSGIWKDLLVTDLRTKDTRIIENNIYLGRFLVSDRQVLCTQKINEAIWLISHEVRTGTSEKLIRFEKLCSPQDISGRQIILLEHSDPDRWSRGSLRMYHVGKRDYSKLPFPGLFSYPRFSSDGRNVYALQDWSRLVSIDIRTRKIETILDLTKQQPVMS